MSEKRPSYCPNCGEALPEGTGYAMPIHQEGNGDGGYDTYCSGCGWSGDVWPDAEQGRHAKADADAG